MTRGAWRRWIARRLGRAIWPEGLWDSSTTSGRGISAREIPGGRTRFGPAQETGEHRWLKIGSVSTTVPGKRIRKLAWLMWLMATWPSGTSDGGGAKAASARGRVHV